ncbi:MAG: NAD-dependent epimerase/dehydratase family protein, partial [Arcanobacterium sp.]|nr:NAD-dependent epimerase/dehydratase family protein [Arcanobacterium sp.]
MAESMTSTEERPTILVAGGAGYIGTHTLVCLYEAGYNAVCVDNFANSVPEAMRRVEELVGASIPTYSIDARDTAALNSVFDKHSIAGVINFAGLKAVGESVEKPIEYYDDNINTTLSLLKAMRAHECHLMIFSSSATVYGMDGVSPLKETLPIGTATNPYGWSKIMNEQILRDVCVQDQKLSAVLLRYFNPIGAHPSGRIGENPKGIPNNVMPYI